MSRGVLDGATANSLAADHHGPLQDDQAVKTKLHTGSCLRHLDQGLGSTQACCWRNRPLEPLCTMARLAQGWAGDPCHIRRIPLTSTGTPVPDVDALCLVMRLANRKNVDQYYIARPFEKTHCPWFLCPLNDALALAPFPSGMVGRVPEAPISCSSRKTGLSDGSVPYSTTSGPRSLMSRCPSSMGAQHDS